MKQAIGAHAIEHAPGNKYEKHEMLKRKMH